MSINNNLSLWENFIESIAQVLSKALNDKEAERLASSFNYMQQRLRELSFDNVKRLELQSKKANKLCKHSGYSCQGNCLRAFFRSFAITYALKYALGFFPALLTGKAFSK